MSNKDDIVKELLDPTDPPYWNGGRWVGRKTDHVLKCEAASAITTLREQLNKEGAKFPCHMGEAAIGSPYKCPHCGATVGVTRTPFDDKRDGIPDRDLVVITLNDLVGKLLRLRTENATLKAENTRLVQRHTDRVQKEHL